MSTSRALVLFSGGLDSATCLYWAKSKFDSVYALSFDYSGRLEQEKRSFHAITRVAAVAESITVDLSFMQEASEVKGLREKLYSQTDSRWSSYVPARNLIFYSIAGHFAERLGASAIIGGHNLHDAEFFRDSSAKFIENLNRLFEQGCLTCDDQPYRVLLPLAAMRRQEIVKLAMNLAVPIELTWSCHGDNEFHCGQCYSCRERLNAFSSMGLSDPVFASTGSAL